jgi:hypothetical protein
MYSRPPDSATLKTIDHIQTPWIDMEGDYEGYWGARGRKLRGNMKRHRNFLAREKRTTRLEVLVEADGMAQAVADYSMLEASGWKGRAGSAVHPDNAQGRFYVAVLRAFGARNEAAVYRYFYDDRLVASNICLQRPPVMISLKIAYDEAHRGTSPAQLMRQEMLQQIFASKAIKKLEFYGRAMDWHKQWTKQVRTLYHVNYYRAAVLARWHSKK